MKMEFYHLKFLALCLVSTSLIVLGFYGIPIDFKVEPEYLVGILTASSILFGFWVLVVQIKPNEPKELTTAMRLGFFWSFGFLTVSVILTYCTALNRMPSVFTLYFCTLSFISNASSLANYLYILKFRA